MHGIKAKLSNPCRPDAAPVEVSFPVRDYEAVYRELAYAGMGDALARECRIDRIESSFCDLSALAGQMVNADELDYLAKRLDGFSGSEDVQFEGMAAAEGISDIEGLINLTFCCQQATVITDFSDLEAIGKEHYMNTHGGCVPVSEMDELDAVREAKELIAGGAGIVTHCGVVYKNGMTLERRYKGREFPAYLYEPCVIALDVRKKSATDEGGTPYALR